MSTLRFGLLTTFYPPYNFGGDGIDVQRTARALVKRGHQATVIHDIDAYEWVAGRHLPAPPPCPDGVEVVGLRSRLGLVSPILTHQFGYPVVHGRKIEALIRERAFDVVVLNNVSLVGGPGLLSFGGDALKVYVAHEHWLVCPTHVLWRFNREPCERPTCTRCVISYGKPLQLWRYTGGLEARLPEVDLFIARSEFSREKHRQLGFPRPMQVLPYFVPGTFPDRPVTRSGEGPHGRPYFLFVGRLTRLKGLDSVITAFARYPDADLLIVGDGEEQATLRALAGEQPNVKFVGRVDNEKLREYYEHAIAAIVPSVGYETFGIVLIESFRFQTPVIARRLGPFPEVVEQSNGGLLFSTGDELLSAMSRLQTDPSYRDQLGANGYRTCQERWSEDVVIGQFLHLIEDALANRGIGKR
jgi:glycosyltransferase involved in cell wall biosynthesis